MRFTTAAALAVAALAATSITTAFQIQRPVAVVTQSRSSSNNRNHFSSVCSRQGICHPNNQSWLSRRKNGSMFSTPTSTVQQQQDAPQQSLASSQQSILEPGEDGIYHLTTPEEHATLLQTIGKDKLVILKVFAPWCRACKGLEPKFLKMSTEPEYNENVPIVWASLSIQNNKAFVQSLGVLALPTVQFYVKGKIVDTFPCGPSKVPIFRKKLTALVQDQVDRTTGTLHKHTNMAASVYKAEEAANRVKLDATTSATSSSSSSTSTTDEEATTTVPSPKLSPEERRRLEETVPYFQNLSLADKDHVLDQAVFMKFEPGSILMREGRMGRTFYVIQTGAVEICQKGRRGGFGDAYLMSDPLVQPAAASLWEEDDGYLGSVVNRLGPGDYFGERALITGEPRAASLRVGTEPVTLWAFDQDVFPASCVLSGKTKNTRRRGDEEEKVDLDEKYGVVLEEEEDNLSDVLLSKQMRDSATASQVRGSVFTRQPLDVEDYDDEGEDVDEVVDADFLSSTAPAAKTASPAAGMVSWTNEDAIFSVLTRFQMIRHVSTCFQYIQKTRAVWGDAGSRNRRGLLANRLSPAQKAEFKEIFQLIDSNGDGYIELKELKRVMETIGEDDLVLRKVLQKKGDAAVEVNGSSSPGPYSAKMTFQDFLGLMAEATFYHLFLDIFSSLDDQRSGFVRAQELDRVLCGVRDLISDDRKSVIDVEDKDMLIDYEQFARMLLGTTLI